MNSGAVLPSGGLFTALVSAKITITRIAVPMTWSRNAVGIETPMSGEVEKMPWVALVWPGSTRLIASA